MAPGCGSRLALRDGRRGTAAVALRQLVADTGATAVYSNRVRRPSSAISAVFMVLSASTAGMMLASLHRKMYDAMIYP